jgi:hypothetical protein
VRQNSCSIQVISRPSLRLKPRAIAVRHYVSLRGEQLDRNRDVAQRARHHLAERLEAVAARGDPRNRQVMDEVVGEHLVYHVEVAKYLYSSVNLRTRSALSMGLPSFLASGRGIEATAPGSGLLERAWSIAGGALKKAIVVGEPLRLRVDNVPVLH